MSSNQWELVTKSKKQRNLEKKVEAHNEKKRLAAAGPNLQEVLAPHQYKKLMAGKNITGEKEQEATPKNLPTGTTTHKSKAAANVKKKNAKEHESRKREPRREPKTKGLEAAIREITVEKFIAHLQQLQETYADAELLWLKGIANFFNGLLPFNCDPTFASKSTFYPTNLLPKPLKAIVLEFLKSVGFANLQYFYTNILTTMTMDLNRNMPVVGYKLMLQLVAQNWPKVCTENMATIAMLRNSYMNRSNVCLSILWAVGQGGYINLMEGIKVERL